jgi:ribosomal protein S2
LNTNGDDTILTNAIPANTNSVKSIDFLANELKEALSNVKVVAKTPVKRINTSAPTAKKEVTEKKMEEKAPKAEKKTDTKKEEVKETEVKEEKKAPAKKPAAKKTTAKKEETTEEK